MGNAEAEIDSAHQDLSEETDSNAPVHALHSFPTFRTQVTQNQKYKEYIQKRGKNARVVMLYDENPEWHKALERSIWQMERNDYGCPLAEEDDQLYNKASRFDELNEKLDQLESGMFQPAQALSQVLQEAESHLQLMNVEIPKSKKQQYVAPKKVDVSIQDFYKTLEYNNN